jgi:hypothetical protein
MMVGFPSPGFRMVSRAAKMVRLTMLAEIDLDAWEPIQVGRAAWENAGMSKKFAASGPPAGIRSKLNFGGNAA